MTLKIRALISNYLFKKLNSRRLESRSKVQGRFLRELMAVYSSRETWNGLRGGLPVFFRGSTEERSLHGVTSRLDHDGTNAERWLTWRMTISRRLKRLRGYPVHGIHLFWIRHNFFFPLFSSKWRKKKIVVPTIFAFFHIFLFFADFFYLELAYFNNFFLFLVSFAMIINSFIRIE